MRHWVHSFPRRIRFPAAPDPASCSRLLDLFTRGVFAELKAAEVDRRMRFPDPFKHRRHSVYLDRFSLLAGVRIRGNDREGLERPCRYAVRPPFALHRLSQGPNGNLLYTKKRARGGSHFLLLTPDQLLAWIATLVPPPRTHAIRYHGVFAPNSKERARLASTKLSLREKDRLLATPARAGTPDAEARPTTPSRTSPLGRKAGISSWV